MQELPVVRLARTFFEARARRQRTCRFCHARDRSRLADGDERYCSVECQSADTEFLAHG